MLMPKISEAIIRHNSNSSSYSRGEDYYHRGAIADLKRRGNLILAAVEGSEATPYQVNVTFDAGGITSACCSCPYDYDGWCKHIVAALLAYSHEPERIEERPTLEELLNRLNHSQTQQLLQELANKKPEIIDEIDYFVNLVNSTGTPKATTKQPYSRRSEIDLGAFRSQVKRILRDGLAELESGSEENGAFTEELIDVIEKAVEFAKNGDGNNAIAILETITTAYAQEADELEDYGAESYEISESLDKAWTEAILSTELDEGEIVDLQVMLESWHDQTSFNFGMSLTALVQGWDEESLQQVLKGDHQAKIWPDHRPEFANNLTSIRLQILEREGRYKEYLHLAAAEEMKLEYLTQLAALGRVEEAMSAAKIHMDTAETAFALAKILREDGYLSEALEIAQSGLNLSGRCLCEFASWTGDLAQGLGDTSTALRASIIAFNTDPSFSGYNKVQELAGETWLTVKLDLLQVLRNLPRWHAEEEKVNIFLHEGLIDDAIAAVKSNTYYASEIVYRVMDAAIPSHPDWVIEQAKLRAELIIDQKKADRYDSAIKWLERVKAGYLQLGQESEWSAYRSQLEAVHRPKRKLMELFKQLK